MSRVLHLSCIGFVASIFACSAEPPVAEEETSRTSDELSSGHDDGDEQDSDSKATYLVGSKTLFLRDPSRHFDPWNEVYGSNDYKTLLAHLNAIGEPRTLVTEIWYPVDAKPGCDPSRDDDDRQGDRCRPHGTRRATYLDYYMGDRTVFDHRGVSPYMITASGGTVGDLMATNPAAFEALSKRVLDELASRKRGSYVSAPAAHGRFPLVILSHGGFTGNVRPDSHREIWTTLGETLASHGYIVMAMNHTGDSRLPTVFHDAGSILRQTEGQAAVDQAYSVLFSQAPVPDRITSVIFQPGGFTIANAMMQRLFEMRTDDVNSVIESARSLNAQNGSFLKNRIDMSNVGVAGHSLGSMTTQIAVSSIPSVTTGMGWNNGLPKSWEPPRFTGIRKPILLSLATEDDLSRTFFTDVPFFVYPNLVPGGQPSDFLFLPGERVFPPTRENPEPVVRNCYNRAAGPKLLLGLVDNTHWDVTDYDDYLFPRHRLARGEIEIAFDNVLRHLPFGDEVLNPNFVGDQYETVSWRRDRREGWVYRPHVVRDAYSLAWFGRYLKGRNSDVRFLRNDRLPDTEVLQFGISRH
jgi:dienelactone hydrolase